MEAEWKTPVLQEPGIVDADNNDILQQLMGSLNICSKDPVIRVYDHEVKGKTIIKPLMGENGNAPQDAGVIRINHKDFTGVAVSNGIIPRYGDIDAYEMSAGSFDEAVRQIIAVGGKLPNPHKKDGIFWTVNDNFCVPDSLYDENKNPDGKYKLAQLVKMNEALYDMATYFNIPLTSGKDSMKNDFKKGNVKISVPPTILYSMVAKIDDVRKTITSDFKEAGDVIYQVGKTYNELGGSECYALFDVLGANVPKVRKDDAKRIYDKMAKANEKGLITSAHDMSDGGLAVALAESAFGGNKGCSIDIPATEIGALAELFAESHSRFIVSVPESNAKAFEKLFADDCRKLGYVNDEENMTIEIDGEEVIHSKIQDLFQAWSNGLRK